MANKRRADPAARPARRLRNDDRTPPTVPSTETIIRFYLHPSSPSLPTPLTGNVIAGGSFARPSEVLRLVSYLEGNIVRGLPGPVNRLLTLWDVEREEMTRPPRIPRHLLTRWTNIHRKVSWSTLVSWRQGMYVLWLRFCLIARWMEWVDFCWWKYVNACSSKVCCKCLARVVFFPFLASLRISLIT